MTDVIKRSAGTPITLGVERDGRLLHLTATPESGKGVKVDGQNLGDRAYLGVNIGTATNSVALLSAPGAAVSTLWQVADQEVIGIGHVFSPSGRPRCGTN